MKLYTIKATFENKVYMLVSDYDANDHFIERSLAFEENGSPNSYDRPFFSHSKENIENLLIHIKNNKSNNKFEIELHEFYNYYSYFEKFEIIEIDI